MAAGAGYNSCRNLEWQLCAAMGKLPGQRSPTIIFAHAPHLLDTRGGGPVWDPRPLGQCGGWAPNGCPPTGYSNDDIFFMEVCAYSMVCANHETLFTIEAEQPFVCEVEAAGVRRLQQYLVGGG